MNFSILGRMTVIANKGEPFVEGLVVTAAVDKPLIMQAFSNDGMGDGIERRHIATRTHGQMVVGVNMGSIDQFDAAGIDDNQFCPLAQAPLELGAEYRM